MFKSTQQGLFLRLHGKVQGVGMRKAVKKIAENTKLKGFVWNHSDGSVCIVLIGAAKPIVAFQTALLQEKHAFITTQQSNMINPELIADVDLRSFDIIDSPLNAGKHAKLLLVASGDLAALATDGQEAAAAVQQVVDEYKLLASSSAIRAQQALTDLSGRFPKARTKIRKIFAQAMPAKLLPHTIISQPSKYDGLRGIASFRELMVQRTRKQHIMPNTHAHEWAINNKLTAYKFCDLVGMTRPEVKDNTYAVATIPKLPNKVVKPVSGKQSIGVFMMRAPDDIIEVATGKAFTSMRAMKERMRKLLGSKEVAKDDWMVEQLVYGDSQKKTPARDFKFLCCYGRVVLVREILRLPTARDCWWDRKGNPVDTGSLLADEVLTDTVGVTPNMIKKVEALSKKIPVPFMRIDFLLSDGELVFNEFTPRPGSFAKFNDATDQLLGDAFLKAESRLVHTLLQGAQFAEFKQIAKFGDK
ncbi:MAG: acylphosphatase [Firmicutes bacterium]|nr:acylphosphatase [Bacillota bacterium]